MTKWAVEFDNDDGMWLRTSPTTHALSQAGYAVGGFRIGWDGAKTYTLHRFEDGRYLTIFETESLDQLNAYINLLLPSKEG